MKKYIAITSALITFTTATFAAQPPPASSLESALKKPIETQGSNLTRVVPPAEEAKKKSSAGSAGAETANRGNANERIYLVSKDDTLSEIAVKFGIGQDMLARYNRISNPDRILAGQKLMIPATPPKQPTAVIKNAPKEPVNEHAPLKNSQTAAPSIKKSAQTKAEPQQTESPKGMKAVLADGKVEITETR